MLLLFWLCFVIYVIVGVDVVVVVERIEFGGREFFHFFWCFFSRKAILTLPRQYIFLFSNIRDFLNKWNLK